MILLFTESEDELCNTVKTHRIFIQSTIDYKSHSNVLFSIIIIIIIVKSPTFQG